MADICDWEDQEPLDIACDKHNPSLITKTLYTQPGHPIILVTELVDGEPVSSRYARELVRRLGLPNDNAEKIFVIDKQQASMPFGTPAYKNDPNTGAKTADPAGTDMHVEGTDYRSNQEMYDFWKRKSNGQVNLVYFEVGPELVVGDVLADGTLTGILATFNATTGIIGGGSEFPKRLAYTIDWKGDPNPSFVDLAI